MTIARDPYRPVVLVILTTALLGAVAAFEGATLLGNLVFLDSAVALASGAVSLPSRGMLPANSMNPHSPFISAQRGVTNIRLSRSCRDPGRSICSIPTERAA